MTINLGTQCLMTWIWIRTNPRNRLKTGAVAPPTTWMKRILNKSRKSLVYRWWMKTSHLTDKMWCTHFHPSGWTPTTRSRKWLRNTRRISMQMAGLKISPWATSTSPILNPMSSQHGRPRTISPKISKSTPATMNTDCVLLAGVRLNINLRPTKVKPTSMCGTTLMNSVLWKCYWMMNWKPNSLRRVTQVSGKTLTSADVVNMVLTHLWTVRIR